MTRYFAQNTPRAGLEHMMMSVPGFQKRGGGMMILSRFCYKPEDVDCRYCLHYRRRSCQVRTCPYIAERLKSGAIEYLDLILEYFGHIPHAGLHKRIQAVEHWSGPDQAVLHTVSVHLRSRFADRVWDDAPPGYLAALYLLASKERLWQPALPALSHDSIDFSRIVSKPHGFAIQDYPIFYSARRLYDLKSPMEAEDLAHPKLVSDLDFHNIIYATMIARYGKAVMDASKLQLIKKYAEQGKFDILLVFMFDRLGRKSDETPFVVEWFTKKGVRVWSVQEGEQRFESHTDRLTNYIRFWQADGESQKTSMRTKTALGQMVEEGRFRGGNAPYGYRLEKSGILNKRKHEVYMLVIDEDEARVVRMMFDLCISSGYGRWRLANFLNDHGIKNRKGQNWHDASVGGILHNPLYKGILRSGETYAGPFEALQIIAPDQFDLAQKLMLERTNERKERRTVPLNTAGQSLLSGNIFCGHCGGRLVLTTNGTTTRLADGTPVHKKRIRYVCYNKTRRRQECTGQTGYTMHILDGIVTEVLHQVFDKMQGASNDMIVGSAVQKQMAMIRSELQRARAENTKANKEYESLKSEVLKAIQGKSALPQDVLTEMLEDTRQKVLSTSERITTLTAELNDGNSKIEEMKAEFNRIVSWSKIFDESPMEVKKMICGYIIKKVSVFRDYRVKIEFNINVEQFLNGIDSIDECATYELPMAQ